MSELLTDDDLRTKREPVKEPSKRWRNWGRLCFDHTATCNACGKSTDYEANAARTSCCEWFPSKDLAETTAACRLAKAADWEYLGAYPEGERP